MKNYFILLALALVTLASCEKDNPIPEPSQGEQANISVAMPADDSGIKQNWQAGDHLTVSRGGENQTFTLKSGEGTTFGTFNGIVPGGTGNYTLTYGSGDMKGQAQSADASTAHLKKYIRLEAVAASLFDKIDLKMTSSMMTFALSGLPADIGTLQRLTWVTEGDTKTNLLPLDLTGCTLSGGTLSAYLAFMPTEMNIKKGGKLTVTLTGSQKSCKAVMTLADGKSYTANQQYATPLNGTNAPWQAMTPPMAFTVKVDATNGLGFNIPFPESGPIPAEITVDWGDGSAPAMVAAGTALSGDDSFNHTYASAGTYQIAITSSQTDDTKQQMPEFKFDSLRNDNLKKLISMDTPMLNTGATDFSSCFAGCTSLKSIPVGLFDKNTQVTDFFRCFLTCPSLTSIPAGLFDKNTQVQYFSSCFAGCRSLKSIPAGLFDKNTQVEYFTGCFLNCTSLESIPVGLFDKNTKVIGFAACFAGCSSLKSIPARLFDQNTLTTDFERCFEWCTSLESIPAGLFDKNTLVTKFTDSFLKCTSLKSIPAGLFDKNTQVTSFMNCFISCTSLQNIPAALFDKNTQVTTFYGCFANCTSLTSVPSGLFSNNTQATSFKGCFADCTSLVLNPKIFSFADDKATRFSGKEMDFESCFLNVGSALTDASSSIAPDLWNYTTGGATWTTKDGYKGCKASNTSAADVPVAWGGSK